MKKLRVLLLLGVTMALAAVVSDYVGTRRAGLRVRLAEPAVIPSNLNSQASRWKWSQSSGNRRSVEGSAERVRQTKDSLVLELEGVELKVFHEGQRTFDRIMTSAALFNTRTEKLYSEVEVVITLGLSVDPAAVPEEKPTVIRGTGVTFESKAATCSTDRYTEYEFEGGAGHSTGAFYDSIHRYFRMKSGVYLERFPARPGAPPLKVRAGELTYHEREQRVDLRAGVALERGSERLAAEEAVVFLEEGNIRRIDAIEGGGADVRPEKVIRFQARRLETSYTPDQTLENVTGLGDAELSSRTPSSSTKVNGERIHLHYVTPEGASQSELQAADVREGARIEFHALGRDDTAPAQTRRVISDWVHLKMRSGGEDMETLETLSPGRLELLPQHPSRPKRILNANRIKAYYAPRNRMEKLEAGGEVSLESLPGAVKDAPPAGHESLRSWSESFAADFDRESGEIQRLKQWDNFRFERDGRRGSSKEASFDPELNRIELQGGARVWDNAGNVSAQRIVLDDKTGDLTAEEGVSSAYREAVAAVEKPVATADFFSASDPVFGTADRMVSHQKNGQLHYFGNVRLWQEEQRIEAERIKIDRQAKTLSAEGNVVSFLRADEKRQGGQAVEKGAGEPAPTMRITGDSMCYDEAARRVVYVGRVELRRARLTVKSDRLEALFRSPDARDSSGRLEKVVATGGVGIREMAEGRHPPRQGFGNEAEYQPVTQKVTLRGAPARVVDEEESETRGAELTYYLNDDRLLVQGGGDSRSYTLRRRTQR